MALIAMIGEICIKIEIKEYRAKKGAEIYKIMLDKNIYDVDISTVNSQGHLSMIVGNKSYDVDIRQNEKEFVVTVGYHTYRVKIEDETKQMLAGKSKDGRAGGEILIKAPMPGLVVSIDVKPDEEINAGRGLVILEAMKMQNELRAPRAGSIKTINVKVGEKVNGGDVLLVIK